MIASSFYLPAAVAATVLAGVLAIPRSATLGSWARRARSRRPSSAARVPRLQSVSYYQISDRPESIHPLRAASRR